jgi:very-short-patch-repair endonuclease
MELNLESKSLHDHYLQGQSQAGQKIINIWKQLNPELRNKEKFSQEVMFNNVNRKRNPYSVDCYIKEGHIFIEIDGVAFHTDKEKETLRDNHILSHDVHGSATMLRIPFDIPQELIFGKLQGKKRQEIKAKYEGWLFDFARSSLQLIRLEILRKTS